MGRGKTCQRDFAAARGRIKGARQELPAYAMTGLVLHELCRELRTREHRASQWPPEPPLWRVFSNNTWRSPKAPGSSFANSAVILS